MTTYLASPVATFADIARYEHMKQAAVRLTGDTVLPARGLYGSMDAWKAKWPDIRRKMDRLVFFTDTDGSIGRGTYWEIRDIRRDGKPVFWLKQTASSNQVALVPFDQVELVSINGAVNWTKYMEVREK